MYIHTLPQHSVGQIRKSLSLHYLGAPGIIYITQSCQKKKQKKKTSKQHSATIPTIYEKGTSSFQQTQNHENSLASTSTCPQHTITFMQLYHLWSAGRLLREHLHILKSLLHPAQKHSTKIPQATRVGISHQVKASRQSALQQVVLKVFTTYA